MYLKLSEDLRDAVRANGRPLKLVDPISGQVYLLVRSSEPVSLSLSNTELRELAKRCKPPLDWLESDEEDLF
jgi:hypothetical protein